MEVPRGRQVPVPALSQLVYPLALALTAVLIVLVVVGTRTPVLDALAYQQARQSAEAALGGAQEAVDRDERLGVDSEELAPLKTQLVGVAAHQRSAKTTRDERAVAGEGSAVGGRADALGNRYRADLSAIHQSAAQFIAGGKSTEAMRAEAQATLGSARDRAVLATWLNENGVGLPYRALEQFAQALSSADRAQVAEAAAGVAFYADRLHKQLLAGMPDKAIVISIHAQQLTAYEGGKPVIDTPITSGRLPELPTDIGPMAVLRKDSPWTMHSPWPKGSPNWYPDAKVQMVLWDARRLLADGAVRAGLQHRSRCQPRVRPRPSGRRDAALRVGKRGRPGHRLPGRRFATGCPAQATDGGRQRRSGERYPGRLISTQQPPFLGTLTAS